MKPILQRGRNCWRIPLVREAGLLVDGRSYYRAFCEAARQSRRFILLAGWQFDSEVALLRGEDAKAAGAKEDVRLLPFLNSLCEQNPKLRVYILAWDFSVLYTFKREFLQSLRFQWNAHERVQFLFDNSHPIGASHHQKFVVVDGVVAFVGGMDLCEGTWDDRDHRIDHPLRVRAGAEPSPSRHDVQACVTGGAARRLARLFVRRWRQAGGGRLWVRKRLTGRLRVPLDLRLAARRVAISRTFGETLVPRQKPVTEVRSLFLDAIGGAEKLIYAENQYFASEAVFAALVARMQAPRRSKLQIVLILPRQPEAFIEEIGLGTTQARYLRGLTEVATATGHAIGIYNTRSGAAATAGTHTFIHAKVMIVDDQFLTVGSANFANRSMGFDSELNLTWQAGLPWHSRLTRSICAARVDLLAEHCGVVNDDDRQRLAELVGLVDFLNKLADQPGFRLCQHRIGPQLISEWVTALTPHDLIIDPKKSVLTEQLEDFVGTDQNGLFTKGLSLLNQHLFGDKH